MVKNDAGENEAMTDLFLGLSPYYLYFQGKPPQLVSELHHPYFLAFSPAGVDAKSARKKLIDQWNNIQNS